MTKSASKMTEDEIHVELKELAQEWDEFFANLEGMSGSPGEWMYERINELETELERRKNGSRT